MNISPHRDPFSIDPPVTAGIPRAPRRMSQVLAELATRPDDNIRLADLLTAVGDRAFGALMFVLAIPNVLPLPPGTSSVFAVPLILVTAQLCVGRRVLWLPAFLAKQSLPRLAFADIVRRLMPYLLRAETFLKPRAQFLMGPVGDRVIGAIGLVMALVLFLPILFGNGPPAVAIAALGLGLLERDGVFVAIGGIAAIASVAFLYAIGGAMLAGFEAFFLKLFEIGGF